MRLRQNRPNVFFLCLSQSIPNRRFVCGHWRVRLGLNKRSSMTLKARRSPNGIRQNSLKWLHNVEPKYKRFGISLPLLQVLISIARLVANVLLTNNSVIQLQIESLLWYPRWTMYRATLESLKVNTRKLSHRMRALSRFHCAKLFLLFVAWNLRLLSVRVIRYKCVRYGILS